VTIRDLLTHTSGLPRESAFPYWSDNLFPSREEMIAALKTQRNIFEPETRYHYSNLGMAILGEVVASASHEPYERFVSANILAPLGMTRTSVFFPGSKNGEVALGYSRRLAGGKRISSQYVDSKGIAPAANITSTVEDLAKYLAGHLGRPTEDGKPLLKRSTLREMHRVHWIQPHWKSGWGLGFSVVKAEERTTFGHGGWIGSTRSQILASPSEEIGVAVVVNADDGNPATFAERALSLFAAAVAKVRLPGPPPPPPEPVWDAYVGRYVDPDSAVTDVAIRDGKLVMIGYSFPPEESPSGGVTELIPAGPHTFRISEDGAPGEFVIFEMAGARVARIKATENYLMPAGR
jgi:CubicO group peptidase (beta-lactamase class C family)